MNGKRKAFYAAVLLLGAALAVATDTRIAVREYGVETDKISGSFVIAQISDLHNFIGGKRTGQILAAVKGADVIVLTGDIADDREGGVFELEELFRKLAGEAPCFYVTGNHEIWSGASAEVKALALSCGIRVLEGGFETLLLGGNGVNIAGTDDMSIDLVSFQDQLESAGKSVGNGNFTVLLTHRPEYVKQYLRYGFDLILCGHDHGGQAAIPYLLNGLVSPDTGFFPQYAGGEYRFGAQEMIVSRGLSLALPRLFNRPEIVRITVSGK